MCVIHVIHVFADRHAPLLRPVGHHYPPVEPDGYFTPPVELIGHHCPPTGRYCPSIKGYFTPPGELITNHCLPPGPYCLSAGTVAHSCPPIELIGNYCPQTEAFGDEHYCPPVTSHMPRRCSDPSPTLLPTYQQLTPVTTAKTPEVEPLHLTQPGKNTENHQDTNFVVIGGTTAYGRYSQWRQS